MKIKIFKLSVMALFAVSMSLQAYAIGCPRKCSSVGGEPKTGWCGDFDGPDGGRACLSTGVGEKNCTGTSEPVICDPE